MVSKHFAHECKLCTPLATHDFTQRNNDNKEVFERKKGKMVKSFKNRRVLEIRHEKEFFLAKKI